jgi:hypothetical protein
MEKKKKEKRVRTQIETIVKKKRGRTDFIEIWVP